MKRLYKSRDNKVLSGIIGGIEEYLDIDPVILRLLWILVLIMTGILPGVIVYIIAHFIVPEKPV